MGTKDWKTALVTGGAGGLGFELARQCAARGMDVVLVGRNEERLVGAAAQLEFEHNIKAHVIVCDLAKMGAAAKVSARVREMGLVVDVLVNNAGFGYDARFVESDMARQRELILTNDLALVELVGENTVHLDSEIAKIALAHRGNDPVSEHEVRSLVSRTTEATPWEFVDAFAARDLKKCLIYRAKMESTSPHALIAMCTTRLREIMCAKVLAERGNPNALASALTEYAKIANPKARPKQAWQVKGHSTLARRFSREELRRAIITARDAERAMKSGADPEAAFMDWITSVCTGR